MALPSLSKAVEATVASELGCIVKHIRSEQLRQDKTKTPRKYMKHLLHAGAPVNRNLMVFTKSAWSGASKDVERYLSEVSLPEFRTPRYYGRTTTAEGDIGVWEYVSDERQQLITWSRDDRRRIVRALAAVNTLTADIVRHVPDIYVGTKYMEPVADRLRAILVAEKTMLLRDSSLHNALDRFAVLEAGALARLASIGNRFFSHQDVSDGNVLFSPAPSPVVIIDWESGGIAAPGASLRRFMRFDVETRVDLTQHYVDCLKAKGISVEVADVMFVMGAASVFAKLHAGVLNIGRDPKLARKAIRSGLTWAPDYLGRSADGRSSRQL